MKHIHRTCMQQSIATRGLKSFRLAVTQTRDRANPGISGDSPGHDRAWVPPTGSELGQFGAGCRDPHLLCAEVDDYGGFVLDPHNPA